MDPFVVPTISFRLKIKLEIEVAKTATKKIVRREYTASDVKLLKTHSKARVKTQLTMLRFNGLVNRIGGPTDAGELVLV